MARKRIIHPIIWCLLLLTISFPASQGQPPAPPPEHGINGNQGAGGAAPVGGGVGILLLCGLGYGIRKMIRDK